MGLSLEIVTPDGVAWNGVDVEAVVLPTESGEIEILSGHIPLVTKLEAGAVGIVKNGVQTDLAVDKGYARCVGDKISILTEAAVNVENVSEAAIEAARKAALDSIERAKQNRDADESELERMEAELRIAIAQKIAKQKRK